MSFKRQAYRLSTDLFFAFQGPTASPLSLFDYLGCYVQSGTRTSSSGIALPSWQATYTSQANSQCISACSANLFTYAGTVNVGYSTVDCWCGNAIAYVT